MHDHHDAVVSKLIAASRGSPCDSLASCFFSKLLQHNCVSLHCGWNRLQLVHDVQSCVNWRNVATFRLSITRFVFILEIGGSNGLFIVVSVACNIFYFFAG